MLALVTGGAGFIGSHLVDALLARGDTVRVLDNLFSGYRENVDDRATLIEAGATDADAVREAVDGVDIVFHQAAHRSVVRSVDDPLATDTANVHGTLTLLDTAADAGVQRIVSASSSSVYGTTQVRPTPEGTPTMPRSPYAVTKLAGEHYCRVFAHLGRLETVSLRYFNVYGPRQRPDSPYAAVIPLFIDALRHGQQPEVHGDGTQTRDFTYVSDVVAANLAAAAAPAPACQGQAYNIAGGAEHSINDLLAALGGILGVEPNPRHADPRPGDVRNTCADATSAREHLGFKCRVGLEEGLAFTVSWFTKA